MRTQAFAVRLLAFFLLNHVGNQHWTVFMRALGLYRRKISGCQLSHQEMRRQFHILDMRPEAKIAGQQRRLCL